MPNSPAPSDPVTPERLWQFAWGFGPSMMLQAGVKNRVFDALDAGPKNLDEIVAFTGASKRGVRLLLNALAGFGLVQRQGDRFVLAPDTAMFLVSSKPAFLGGMLAHLTGQLMDTWRNLPEIVRTGKPAIPVNQQKQGAEFFRDFVEGLFNLNYGGARALAEVLAKEFPSAQSSKMKVLDIAAGSGVWGIAMAERFPQAHITAVDWAPVIPVTRRIVGQHHLTDRFSAIEGDINQVDYGTGFNIATLGHILHSEGEARSKKLLKKVYDSLAPGGVIAIAEFVQNDDRNGPPYPLLFAVNMLVHTDDGETFTFAQMTGWLKEIGFGKMRVVEVPAPSPILVGVKP